MLLYLLIGTGMNLSVDWLTDAQNIAANASPGMSALEIMGASIIFMMLCWQIPKLFAAVLGGSPALSGGDLVSSGTFIAGGAMAVGSMGLSLLGAAAGATGLLSSGAGVAGSTAGTSSSPAMLAAAGSNSGGAGTMPPPANPPPPPSGGPSQPAAPSGDATRNTAGTHRRISSQIPPDSGPHATPPRLNLDQNE
jgi:hypothetical protein